MSLLGHISFNFEKKNNQKKILKIFVKKNQYKILMYKKNIESEKM